MLRQLILYNFAFKNMQVRKGEKQSVSLLRICIFVCLCVQYTFLIIGYTIDKLLIWYVLTFVQTAYINSEPKYKTNCAI